MHKRAAKGHNTHKACTTPCRLPRKAPVTLAASRVMPRTSCNKAVNHADGNTAAIPRPSSPSTEPSAPVSTFGSRSSRLSLRPLLDCAMSTTVGKSRMPPAILAGELEASRPRRRSSRRMKAPTEWPIRMILCVWAGCVAEDR